MAGHIKTEVFFPAWSLPLCELSGDDLRKEALSRLKATADGAEDDCRELTQRVDELVSSDKWRELASNWDSFCVEYFKKPSAFIDAIVNGVRILQRQGHDGKITTTDAVQAAREMPLADKAGAPIGSSNNPSGKARQDTVPNVDIININPRPTGTSKEYLLRRLSRDFPQALDRIQAGELSTRKAAIEYGIIKVKTPMQIIHIEIGKLVQSELIELQSYIKNKLA